MNNATLTRLVNKIVVTILVVNIIFMLFSCVTTAPLMSNRKPYEIDSVSVCHLPSFITAIEKGNQQKFSQSYSDSAFYLRYSSFKSTMP
jgi:hypothetical protein